MAELLLKVDDGSGYEDGDVLCAFSERHIACQHAQSICHYRHAGLTDDELRPDNSLARMFFDSVYQYQFRRTSATEVERTETDYVGNVIAVERFGPPEINVGLYIARRKKHPLHRIFGKPGREVWHGGRSDLSASTIDHVWDNIIHQHSPHRKQDVCPACGRNHIQMPLGRLDVKHHLPIRIADALTDEECNDLVSSEFDETVEERPMLKKRRWKTARWQPLLAHLRVTHSHMRDKQRAIGVMRRIGGVEHWYADPRPLAQAKSMLKQKPVRDAVTVSR